MIPAPFSKPCAEKLAEGQSERKKGVASTKASNARKLIRAAERIRGLTTRLQAL
jgi:hypothetical protein